MFVHLLSAAALTGGLLAAPGTPGPVSAVTTLKYKVGIVNLSTIDLSGLGAGEQKNTAGFTGFFTMTLKDTTGGKALTMVLDSMAIVKDFWAEPSYAQLLLAMQNRVHDYVVAGKGTPQSALDALEKDWSEIFKEDGKIK